MIKNYHLSHAVQYALLIVVFLFTIPLLFIFEDQLLRLILILFLSFLYFILGIVHHKEEKNLNKPIVLEYLAISILIFIVLFSLFR